MHSCFPHPNARLIILRLDGKPDRVDLQTIPRLLENRVRELGRILLLLDIQHSEESSARAWRRVFLNDHIRNQVERLSVVTTLEGFDWVHELSVSLIPASAKSFHPAQHEEALLWVQKGEASTNPSSRP